MDDFKATMLPVMMHHSHTVFIQPEGMKLTGS
jgi:hypothetical protein